MSDLLIGKAIGELESVKIRVEASIPLVRVRNLLRCGFEGIRYWVSSCEFIGCESVDDLCEGGKGYVRIVDDMNEGRVYVLNWDVVVMGLEKMCANGGFYWNMFMEENEDARVGDVFIQYCLLGEERYMGIC
tara:strand:+ start:3637 stop:4032 length:396 start_codon:yes stop_codon:yes gene_type:complete